MTIAQLIPMAINLSMGLMVFALGLQASWRDAAYLLRQPGLFARSLLSMNVIMVLLAIAMDALFALNPAVKLALVALALSPVPPVLPGKQTKAGGSVSYTASLLVTMAALSVVIVPLGIALIGRTFGFGIAVPASQIISIVATGIVLPLIIGLLVRQFAPALASRLARPLSLFATILLAAAFIPVLMRIWPAMAAMIGNGSLAALAFFVVVGVLVGHGLGGPEADNRTVLALATATRHPGVAIAIAHATFPDEKAAMAVVLWHLIVSAILCIPYVNWRKRVRAATQSKTAL